MTNVYHLVSTLSSAINELVHKGEFETAQELSEILTTKIQNAIAMNIGEETITVDGRTYNVTNIVKMFTHENKKVAAIKGLRELVGRPSLGLKEAKEFIEQPKYMAIHLENFPENEHIYRRV